MRGYSPLAAYLVVGAILLPVPSLTANAQTATPADQKTQNTGSDVAPDRADQPGDDAEAAPPAPPLPPAIREIVDLLEDQDASPVPDKETRNALTAYYTEHVEEPLWVSENGRLTDNAQSLISELGRAADWGLKRASYQLPELITSHNSTSGAQATIPQNDRARAEIILSATAIKYADDARGARIPNPTEQLSSYLDRAPQIPEVSAVLNGLRKADSAPDKYLRSLHPQHPQFEKLRKALLALRNQKAQEARPEDIKLPSRGPLLRAGVVHKDVALLRKRLEVPVSKASTQEGAGETSERTATSNTDAPPEDIFDDALETAVKAYQKDNGLSADGIVGRGTRRALNASATEPVTEQLILANMEEWRWMPNDLGPLYVTVNIPEYKVRVIKDGVVIHEERAIVGKTNNQTPVFSDQMETIVLHPFWGVPNSIKVKELLPSLARGGSVLQRQGLRVQKNGRDINPNSVNWSYADIRKYHVYQPPGRRNVLGVVKFLFPNKHHVYMHDTPTKHLFQKTRRTYSHGCMRLQNPLRIAEIILEHDKSWSPEHIQELVSRGPKNNNITLDTKVPVHVTYFTAVADDDGTVRRFNDVYGHEQRINLALAGRFAEIQRGRDHLAPVRYTRPRYTNTLSANDIFQSIFGGF